MEWTSAEVLNIINSILPGFVAAWVFFGLTAHPRREPFERVVQALIFTVIVQALTSVIKVALLLVGYLFVIGPWTAEVALVWNVANALWFGVLVSACANKNWCHDRLLKWGITKRTSYPSEWYNAFQKEGRYVVLHLKDLRRIHGWPEEWPDSSESGHFVLYDASWLLDDNRIVPMYAVEQILIPASSVHIVEICKHKSELTVTQNEIEAVERLLGNPEEKGDDDGKQGSPAQAEQSNGRGDGQAASAGSTFKTAAATATCAKEVNGE